MKPDTSNPKLVPKRHIDPVTGKTDVDYYWEQQLAPKVQITGKLADQLCGYVLIKKDLDSALNWINAAATLAQSQENSSDNHYHATKREVFDLVKAYFVAALTFYGKCFTEAAGRHTQLSRDLVDSNLRDLHDFYMMYRHNFAAHSGDERLELAKTYVLVHPTKNELIPHLPTSRMQPDLVLFEKGEPGLADLIKDVSAKVLVKYDKLSQKIIRDLVVPQGPAFWRAAASTGEPILLALANKDGG
jgi:hypothetical protein